MSAHFIIRQRAVKFWGGGADMWVISCTRTQRWTRGPDSSVYHPVRLTDGGFLRPKEEGTRALQSFPSVCQSWLSSSRSSFAQKVEANKYYYDYDMCCFLLCFPHIHYTSLLQLYDELHTSAKYNSVIQSNPSSWMSQKMNSLVCNQTFRLKYVSSEQGNAEN